MISPSKLILLWMLLLLVWGCTNPFHPKMRNLPSYSNRTPGEVLNNLVLAYKQKNIELYKTLLAEDFRFELISSEVSQIGTDMNGDGINDDWWGYDQEVEYTTNLFQYGSSDGIYPPPDEIDLKLSIPGAEYWEIDPQQGNEDWVVIPCSFTLTLTYNQLGSSLTATGTARFYLKPVGDRWYIAVWRDESNL
ncbi:MAG: hypothetical protein PHI68_05455 [Candidatus Cloacimonetes bacterium]|nr:hypothetical protein [Candidatus Cloacimonadota bacterium]